VAAGTDPGGGGTPPSPPPTSSSDTSAGGSSAGATEAGGDDEPAGTPGPGRATRRVRALSLAPWASRTAGRPGAKPSARPWPKGAAKAPARPDASGGRVPAAGPLARRPSRKALPLWLCIGAPLVAVVVAFVAIAALTAPSGSGRSSVGLRTGAGDDTPATTADDDGGAPDLAAPRATATTAPAAGDEVAAPTTTEAPAPDDAGDAEDTSDDAAAAPATTATTAAPAPEAPAAPAPADTPGDEVRPLLDQVASQLCHPSYLACVPVADDVDCRGEGTGPDHDGPEFTDRVVLIGPDEYRLDSDGDGIGCD
jgi:hypothetical protein